GESDNELADTLAQFRQNEGNSRLLTKPFARKILIKELVKTTDSISGKAAENLRWLYEELALGSDSFRSFQTGAWHRKAAAIQHLAEMQQSNYLVRIYRETNNKNPFIRTEAQLAVVKMTGFKGLRFLTIVSHAISQWQQLSLLSHLQEGEAEEENIKSWLNQKNDSVVEFALRLVEHYRCYDLHDDVIACLQHVSPAIRLQALEALKEIHNDTTAKALVHHFPMAAREEKLCILALLCETTAGTDELDFLTSLLNGEDEAIRFRALQAIQQISPAWSLAVSKQMQHHPSFANILPLLQKEAV
ncbi:MAG TPA: hypothetical protein VFT06_07970, partial [Flavisolibacter sp.]|nr:hypothetical protein [Flavisolibacter sp.]